MIYARPAVVSTYDTSRVEQASFAQLIGHRRVDNLLASVRSDQKAGVMWRMDLERFRGYFLSEIAVTTASEASTVRIALVAAGGVHRVTLLIEDVLHISMDTPQSWDDFVDAFTLLHLPQHGPWPEQVHHLLHHHTNRSTLTWLRMDGPSPIEILGAWPTVED